MKIGVGEKDKSPRKTIVSKKRKIESSPAEKRSLKRKIMQTSESEIDDEVDVQDIVPSFRRNISVKRVSINVSSSPLDNVYFTLNQVFKDGNMLAKGEFP